MSRCKSCNAIMSEEELRRKDGFGGYSELCAECLDIVYLAEYDLLSEHNFTGDFYVEGRRGGALNE